MFVNMRFCSCWEKTGGDSKSAGTWYLEGSTPPPGTNQFNSLRELCDSWGSSGCGVCNCRNFTIRKRSEKIRVGANVIRLMTIVGIVLLTLSALLVGANWFGIISARHPRVGFSCVPILGGLLGCVGFLLIPKLRLTAFIPPLVDIGFVPTLCVLFVHVLRSNANGARRE
jgi:hypothetical protein